MDWTMGPFSSLIGTHTAALTVLFTVAHVVLYTVLRLVPAPTGMSPLLREELATRATSAAHAAVQIVNVIAWFRHEYSDLSAKTAYELSHETTDLQALCLSVTLAFLIFDLLRMYYVWWYPLAHGSCMNGARRRAVSVPMDMSMVLHHIIIIFAYGIGLYFEYGTYFLTFYLLNEVTTPFLAIRNVLSLLKLKHTTFAQVNDVMFAASFAVFRFGLNFFIYLHVVWAMWDLQTIHPQSPKPLLPKVAIPTLGMLHTVLNIYWFGLIVRLVVRKFVRPGKGGTGFRRERHDGTQANKHGPVDTVRRGMEAE